MERNPLRVFDCKNEQCRVLVADAPKPRDHLCRECAGHFDGVLKEMDRMELAYEFNDRLVRGLDYYNRTTFEYISGRLGAQDSLGGGGRYDYLVADFGGPDTPGIGLAIGTERTMLAMPDDGKEGRRHLAFVVWMTDAERDAARGLVDRLRAAGIPTQMDCDATRPKHQFKSADAVGAACCVIVGPDEESRGVYSVKDLATGEQVEVPHNIIAGHVRALFR
jgi:histidyl-tRNA synthetase